MVGIAVNDEVEAGHGRSYGVPPVREAHLRNSMLLYCISPRSDAFGGCLNPCFPRAISQTSSSFSFLLFLSQLLFGCDVVQEWTREGYGP